MNHAEHHSRICYCERTHPTTGRAAFHRRPAIPFRTAANQNLNSMNTTHHVTDSTARKATERDKALAGFPRGRDRGAASSLGTRYAAALLAACVLTIAAPQVSRAALVVDFLGDPVISPGFPSLTLSVENTGDSSVMIGGLNFFITVGDGLAGPTLDTTIPTSPNPALGVDLLTGTLFDGNPLGQFMVAPAPQPRDQGWAVLSLTPITLAAGAKQNLATITFDSFPVGTFSLELSRGLLTSFDDPFGSTIPGVTLPDNDITVTAVPEPAAAVAVTGLALLGVALFRRRRHSLP